jgi:hypothetical protein
MTNSDGMKKKLSGPIYSATAIGAGSPGDSTKKGRSAFTDVAAPEELHTSSDARHFP